ncbi:hypothetical protein E3T61_03125 [Cryobacterium lactosi]|uniref:Uncharacterized protein n=1 Tax=Cryobacterium lactosi TaxID=1259202 RepID=A0A4R9C0M0_9MICO|nr:hypothetical protein [Cryobacterium lactosi]TFD94005.1 hypothetical protein E3T61_03125 [Cryobacterium lactosi]
MAGSYADLPSSVIFVILLLSPYSHCEGRTALHECVEGAGLQPLGWGTHVSAAGLRCSLSLNRRALNEDPGWQLEMYGGVLLPERYSGHRYLAHVAVSAALSRVGKEGHVPRSFDAAHVDGMHSYISYADAHPRNGRGQFREERHSPPELQLERARNEVTDEPPPPPQPVVSASGSPERYSVPHDDEAKEDIRVRWGTELWAPSWRDAAGATSRARSDLYRKLGLAGIDTCETFDRIARLDENSKVFAHIDD